MTNVAIIGCGYWGINYVRVFNEMADSKVVLICDANEERLRAVRDKFQLIGTTTDWEEVLSNKWVDAVVIATPASTHFDLAQRCLLEGKHVMVEKPLTTNVEDGKTLVKTAEKQGRVLMVGHTFMYNSAVRKVKEIISEENFGKVYYLHATRTNMGPVRRDVNAVWDLAAHDIAIFNYLLDMQPQSVSAVGSRVLGEEQEDVGFVTLRYDDGILANIHISWVDPNKERELAVVGSQRRVIFNDLNNQERVRIFEQGVTTGIRPGSFGEFRLLIHDGDIISPHVEGSEPLKNECQHFVDCVEQDQKPLSDGWNGVQVVNVLQAIDASMEQNGAPVAIKE